MFKANRSFWTNIFLSKIIILLFFFLLLFSNKSYSQSSTPVETDYVVSQPLNQSIPILGRLISLREAKVPAVVQGKIDQIFAEVGDKVEKKQVLAVIDLDLYKWLAKKASAGVEAARAKLNNARAVTNLNKLELSRLEELKDSPSFEVEAAKAALDNAQAITNSNRLELNRLEGLKSSPAFNAAKFEDLQSKMVALKANEAMAKANLNIALQNEKLASHKAKYEDLQNKISALLANEEIARANLDIALQNEKLASHKAKYEDLKNKITALLANEEIAIANLNKKIIKAPFNGIVGLKNISVGEYLEPGEIATTLDATNPIELDFEVPESAISTLNAGTTITTYTRAWGEELFTGKIKSINSRVNKESRSITVRAQIDNPDNRLKPGMFMIVKLPIFNREEAIIVPEEAIITDGTQRTVYAIEEDTAKAKPVKLGERLLGEVEVTNGLEKTSIVIVGGIQKVRDGTKVIIRNKEK